jgi:hypothetical protein
MSGENLDDLLTYFKIFCLKFIIFELNYNNNFFLIETISPLTFLLSFFS